MKKVILGVTIAIITLLSNVFNASAMTPTYGGKLTWNIGNIHYYLSGESANYADIIAASANNWVNTGVGWNPLWPNDRTYVQSEATFDFYTATSGGSGVVAETKFFGTGSYCVYPSELTKASWDWNEIWIYTSTFNTLSSSYKQGTITHEMGHAFGLAHTSDKYSIMCQIGAGRAVNTVQAADNEAFNSKYN